MSAGRLRILSREFNDGIVRYAAKMATGAGKAAVMGMLIAWQTLNAVSTTRSRNLRHGQRFAVLTPGLTVRERLQVLLPSHPDNIYDEMGLVPRNLRGSLNHARVKIINFQAFSRRDLLGGKTAVREVLRVNKDQGREDPQAAAERVLRELTRGSAYGDVVVINDEAHHCWLPSEQTTRAKKKAGPASVWFNAVRALRDAGHLGRRTADGGQESVVYDFSATPMWIGTPGLNADSNQPRCRLQRAWKTKTPSPTATKRPSASPQHPPKRPKPPKPTKKWQNRSISVLNRQRI